MVKIDINKPIKELVTEYPEIKKIMISLGFKQIVNPAMLNTVGRFTTIKKGAKMRKISLEEIKNKFLEHHFVLEENNE